MRIVVYFSTMPEVPKEYGKELTAWQVTEGHIHARSVGWYAVAIVAGLALLIYAVVTRNFLFGFIVIMFGVIMATHSVHPPAHFRCALTELGIHMGGRFYPWRDIEKFWIIYQPPEVKMLYVDFGGLRPRLPIPLEDADPNEVRTTLSSVVTEDTSHTDEPFSDWLIRVLKI